MVTPEFHGTPRRANILPTADLDQLSFRPNKEIDNSTSMARENYLKWKEKLGINVLASIENSDSDNSPAFPKSAENLQHQTMPGKKQSDSDEGLTS